MPSGESTSRDPRWVVRCALGAIAFFVALAATYATLRGYDVLFASEANPATVIYMPGGRIAMYWRAAIAAYVGGTVALLVVWLARTHEAKVTRTLVRALPFVVALAGAQAVLLP